jgi:hypothetical protein
MKGYLNAAAVTDNSSKPSCRSRSVDEHGALMTRPEAIQQIRDAAKTIALQMMKIHPALPHLQDSEIMGDSLKCLHEMTVQLEVIKKKIGKLERQDDSTLL